MKAIILQKQPSVAVIMYYNEILSVRTPCLGCGKVSSGGKIRWASDQKWHLL